MKRFQYYRFFYWLSFVLIMFFVVLPMFFFFYLFDEDKVRSLVVDQFSHNYSVEINGSVIPKLWHGLSLELKNITIIDDKNQELIKTDTVSFQLSWLDLAIGRYRVKRISINGMKIKKDDLFNIGARNLLNFSNPGSLIFNKLNAIDVSAIQSFKQNSWNAINNGTLKIRHFNQHFDLEFGFRLNTNGTYLKLLGNSGIYRDNQINFQDFNIELHNNKLNLKAQSSASYSLNDLSLQLSNVMGYINFNDYSGQIKIDKTILSMSTVDIINTQLSLENKNDFFRNALTINIFKIYSNNFYLFNITNSQLIYEFISGKNYIKVISKSPDMLFDKQFNIKTNLCESHIVVNSSLLNSNAINLTGKCNYIDNKFDFDLSGAIDNNPANIHCQVTRGDRLNLNLVADLSSIKLNTKQLSNSNLTWFENIDMNANFNIKNFIINQTTIANLKTKISFDKKELNLPTIKANIYNGQFDGQLKIIKNNDSYGVNTIQAYRNLNLQLMLKDLFDIEAISAQANVDINLNAKNIHNIADIKKNINGPVKISATNGAFQGIDFNLLTIADDSLNKKTIFNNLTADFNFKDGISNNGNINFTSLYAIAKGSGKLSLPNLELDYKLNTRSILPQNVQRVNSIIIPFNITGNIFKPKINIQNAHLLQNKIIKKTAKRLVNKKRKATNK